MKHSLLALLLLLLAACNTAPHNAKHANKTPEIYPDYIGVTIPASIAPMNFDFAGGECDRIDVVITGSKGGRLHSGGKRLNINIDKWHALTERNKGGRLTFEVSIRQGATWTGYKPFDMFVSSDDLGEWGLTYRRIAPGYEVFGRMGIYQRDLSTFKETAIIENTLPPGACFNCHTSNRTDPEQITFHVRGEHGATFIRHDGKDEILQAVNDSIGGSLVYPYWHPSGKWTAYSTNTTRQGFHAIRSERIEVFDQASDVLIFDPETHTILRDTIVGTKSHYETYPVFSPDGKTLYFCSSTAEPIPARYQEIKYNICRIAFDPATGQLTGAVDTIFNARAIGKSAIHPRPSYDGRYLMFTLADYGCFPIWHKEADNWLLDLQTLQAAALTEANSGDTDSWHNWSSNSRWFVFTSRRGDGLYTRLYLCHIDGGKASKPFLLPQKSPKAFYDNMLYSYNTPDFTARPVALDKRRTSKAISKAERVATKVKNMNTK
ncbi:MAG: hypothetical protein LUC26_01220 [Prevotella sp.]|nr:hypothetical protein [Prevotella sp.]